jgi:cystathionine beta-synthase
MKIYNNILETIGNTPMVKLNKIVEDIEATVLAKVETFNPGNSIKDRMALKMIEDAEAKGLLKPGGTIIEGTSGNTGMGLAIAAIIKGYKCIFATTDKQSKEKIDALRAFGAEVIVCPTNVEPEDPRSYYSVSARLSKETPNSYYPNQYDNPSNALAHYEQTGPEIWNQTDGKITHLVVGVGTGGTISGTGKYLKEKNPNIKVWGIDTYGSVFKKYKETGILDKNEIYPYITEGIGEDFLPKCVDFDVIDLFEKVTDKEAAVYTREIVKKEGIFVGNSAGSAIAGLKQLKHLLKKDDVVVVIFHDHGTRYLGKMFNDDWMRDRGFLIKQNKTVADIMQSRGKDDIITVDANQTITEAAYKITQFNVSQVPVIDSEGKFVGSLSDNQLLKAMTNLKIGENLKVQDVMHEPFPIVSARTTIDELSALIEKSNGAVMVDKLGGGFDILTKHDVICAISS